MRKEIDLGPHQYAVKGTRRVPDIVKRQKVFIGAAIFCGLWAAIALQMTREYGVVGRNLPLAVLFVLGPSVVTLLAHWWFVDRHER
jgi:hypothetical protein